MMIRALVAIGAIVIRTLVAIVIRAILAMIDNFCNS